MQQTIKDLFKKLLDIGCVETSIYYDRDDGDIEVLLYDNEEGHIHNDELELELSNLVRNLAPNESDGIHVRLYPTKNKIYQNYTIGNEDIEITKVYK